MNIFFPISKKRSDCVHTATDNTKLLLTSSNFKCEYTVQTVFKHVTGI